MDQDLLVAVALDEEARVVPITLLQGVLVRAISGDVENFNTRPIDQLDQICGGWKGARPCQCAFAFGADRSVEERHSPTRRHPDSESSPGGACRPSTGSLGRWAWGSACWGWAQERSDDVISPCCPLTAAIVRALDLGVPSTAGELRSERSGLRTLSLERACLTASRRTALSQRWLSTLASLLFQRIYRAPSAIRRNYQDDNLCANTILHPQQEGAGERGHTLCCG